MKKNFLEIFTNLEKEINLIGSMVKNITHETGNRCPAFGPSISTAKTDRSDVKNCLYVNETPEKKFTCLQPKLGQLVLMMNSLRSELNALKEQFLSQNEEELNNQLNSSPTNNFGDQISKLTNYVKNRLNNIEKEQKKITAKCNEFTKHSMPLNNVNKRSNLNFEITSRINNHFKNNESKIKELGHRHAKFISEIRTECVSRIRDAIAVETEKAAQKNNFSLKQLSDIIFGIVEREKMKFQDSLHDLNKHVLSALDNDFECSYDNNFETNSYNIVEHKQSDDENERKILLKEINEIQEKIDNNLFLQHQLSD